MQTLANILNFLTLPFSHRIAFETADTTGLFEKWTDETSTNVILLGRLQVIMV